jgi:hypothetical protein
MDKYKKLLKVSFQNADIKFQTLQRFKWTVAMVVIVVVVWWLSWLWSGQIRCDGGGGGGGGLCGPVGAVGAWYKKNTLI